jgi:hypothetical protein
MTPQGLFVVAMGLSALNGMLHMLAQSTLFITVLVLAPVWWPEVFGFDVQVLAYAASLIISTATLLLGGVPAALYERARGLEQPSGTANALWVGGVVLVGLLLLPGLAPPSPT